MMWVIILFFLLPDIGSLRKADDLYKSGKYQEALEIYQKVHRENPGDFKTVFNIANTLYQLGKYEEAASMYNQARNLAKYANDAGNTFYNKALSDMKKSDLQSALQNTMNAIKANPKDQDAKANFEIFSRLLDQQQKQEQQQDKNDDKKDQKDNKDGKDDKNNDQKNQNQQGDDKKDQQQNQQNQNQQQEQNKPQQQDAKISPEQAKRLLDAMKKNEQESLLKKMEFQKNNQRKKAEKDW